MNDLTFVNHHNHSHYSINDCISKIEELVKKALDLKSKSVTITDHGTLGGCYALWKECKKHKLLPILGIEGYFVDDYTAPESEIPWNYAHVILLAKTEEGWRNLKIIQSKAWETGHKKKPRIDLNLLKEFGKGIICTSACIRGLIGWNYFKSKDLYFREKSTKYRKNLIRERILRFKEIFGGDLYLEMHYSEAEEQQMLNEYILSVSERTDGKLIAANDCHYLNKKDWYYHDIMICHARKQNLDDPNNDVYSHFTKQLYAKTVKGMKKAWSKWHTYLTEQDFNESINNTVEIQNKVEQFELKPKMVCLPDYSKEPTKDMYTWVMEGWKTRLTKEQQESQQYKDRLKYECDVFAKLKMENYMLVCADIIRRAKKEKIPCGPGRGSVCGSLVAFCMEISQIDPIRFKTSFDRFLIASRLSLPDIDMDFGKEGRNRIKEIVKELYGADKFVSIATYGDWKPRGLIKDIGKVLGRSYSEMNEITKQIDDKTKKFDDEEAPLPPEIISWLEENDDIYEPAKKLEGIYRSRGVHASGMLLTPTKTEDWVPTSYMVERDSEDKKPIKVSEWDMYAVEDLNILKIDFLGLISLDVIKTACELIGKFDVDQLWDLVLKDLENPKVYEMLCAGHLLGVFQMETSDGMHELTKRMQPICFHDIDLIISIYRTAVIQAGMMDEYIKRRDGEDFEYIHEKAIPALKDTLGVMIYQEQLMQIAVDVGGFSPQESDNFRKATKLKDPEKFKPWKDQFVNGCTKNGLTDEEGEKLWDWCYQFSGYGFNRCLLGSTKIYRFTGNQHSSKEITLEKLYKQAYEEKFSTPIRKKFRRQKHLGLVRIYNPDKHKIQYAKVKDIHKNGVRRLYIVLLENKMEIVGTDNHRLMRADKSYLTISNLNIGDELIVCGEKDKNFNKQRTDTIGGRGWTSFADKRNPKTGRPIIDGRKELLENLKKEIRERAKGCCENVECGEVLGIEKHDAEYHHKDGDHFNNSLENIILVCNSCHKKLDYKIGNRTNKRDRGYFTQTSKIVSIEYYGEEETYDLEMFEEPHNFIANGIVSHNSHSAAYALITYATAYLKVFYPTEFMTAIMTWNSKDDKMMAKYLQEAKRLGIKLRTPRINSSTRQFKISKGKVLYPFNVIKRAGDKAIEIILEERKEGKFESFEDFFDRINKTVVNVGVMTNLILSGAFNILEGKSMEEIFDNYMNMRSKEQTYRQVYCKDCKSRFPCAIKKDTEDQHFCPSCGGTELAFDIESCAGKKFNASFVYNQVYGFNAGANPLKQYVNQISKYKAEPLATLDEMDDGQALMTSVYVKNIKKWEDKNGNQMAFVDVTDGEFDCSLTMFASDWEKLSKEIKTGCCYILRAFKNRGNNLLYSTRGQIKSKLIRLGV